MSASAAPTVMERLRAETADLHSSAEGKDFQRRMVAGELTRDDYARWLGQMLLVHRALEAPLRSLMLAGSPAFAALREEQMQEPYLLEDLDALGEDPDAVAPLPATAALIASVERAAAETPLALLGHHYVLEGSNNGNRYIARKLVPALGLNGRGHRYLDPYGAEQPAKWAQFKRDMDAVGFATEDADLLVAAAREMFTGIGQISEALDAS
jgi:heme oxygenase